MFLCLVASLIQRKKWRTREWTHVHNYIRICLHINLCVNCKHAHICIYVYQYICIYIRCIIYVRTPMSIFLSLPLSVHIYILYVSLSLCVYLSPSHTNLHISYHCILVYMYVYIYIYMQVSFVFLYLHILISLPSLLHRYIIYRFRYRLTSLTHFSDIRLTCQIPRRLTKLRRFAYLARKPIGNCNSFMFFQTHTGTRLANQLQHLPQMPKEQKQTSH